MPEESLGDRDPRTGGWPGPRPEADAQADTVVGQGAQAGAEVPAQPEPAPTKILPVPGQTVVQNPGQGYGQPQGPVQPPAAWSMPQQPPQQPQPPSGVSQGPYWQQEPPGPGQTPVPGQSPALGYSGGYPTAPGPAGLSQTPVPGQPPALGYSGGYTIPPGQQPPAAAWPPAAKRRFPMWLRIGIPVLVVALAAGTFGVIKLTSSPNPAVTKVQCHPQDLASCLVAAPGSASADASDWAKSTTVTSTAYASQFAGSAETKQPAVASLVNAAGVKAIVHKDWTFGQDQVDIVLLRFGTIQGAQAWAHDRDGEFLSTDSGSQLTVPGDSTAKASSSAAPNSSGDYVVHYMTTVGNIDLEVHYASQGSLQQQNFDQWASTEYASLQTAAAPAPDPSPTPTTFQAATCPGGTLTNCLMPMPTGGVVLTGLPTTYTVNSWATSVYLSSAVPSIEQTLNADEVTTIDSEAWGTDGFDKAAQVVLLQTRTPAQAKDLVTTLGGTTTSFPNAFSVPGYPDAQGSYTTTPGANTDVVDGWVDAQVGTVFLSMWFGFNSTFDTATAQTWAAAELTLLTQRTQDHWGFPIPTVSTPSLAPFAADPCSTPGLSSCLMPLPTGATANSGSANPQDPGVSGFVGAIYPSRNDYEESWLSTDGATDAASETWTGSDGASATDYLLKFANGRQAQAAALQEFGDNLPGSQACTVTTLPDTYCVVLPEDDSTGGVIVRVIGWGPHYGFDLEVTQIDSADTKDALTWAQTQAELIGG